MNNLKFLFFTLMVITVLGSGCIFVSPASINSTPTTNITGTQDTSTYPIGATETIGARFPVEPRDLPHDERFTAVSGSFDDTYIGSYDCTNGFETFETNYTYFSGSEGPKTITYQLVPVKYVQSIDETSFPAGIVNATIEPDRFTAEPYHKYTSTVRVTVGPNITGFSSSNMVQNPTFPFYLKVQTDGETEPDANDWVETVKLCYFMPGLGGIMRTNPSFYLGRVDNISLKAGETTTVPLTLIDYGGGIREEYFEISGMLENRNYSFPFTAEELRPNPAGIQFSVDPSQVIGRSFRTYNMTLTIATTRNVSSGTYVFPLELCYRNLASSGDTSDRYPFENSSSCNTGTDFTVIITS